MRLLILNHNNENYGTYYRCFFLGKYLSQLGHDVTMICASGKNFDLLVRTKRISSNFKVVTLPRIKYHKYFTGQLELRFPLSLLFILFYRYDVLHAFTVAQPQIGIPAWVAKKIRGKKVIVDWDDLWGGGFGDEHPFPIKQVLSFFERKIPLVADRITVASEFLFSRTVDLGIDPKIITKIPNGANIEEISPLDRAESRKALNLQNERNLVVSVGRTYTASLHLLLAAHEEVLKEAPDTKLVMVGVDDLPDQLKKKYEHIMNHILCAGPRPFDEVPVYMASADVLVLPMADNPIEKARFPMRFGDYLCSGRPIVSNAVGEVKSYLEDYNCGLTSSPADASQLANNILRVLKDGDDSKSEMGMRARRVALEVLSWEEIVDNVDKIYTGLG